MREQHGFDELLVKSTITNLLISILRQLQLAYQVYIKAIHMFEQTFE